MRRWILLAVACAVLTQLGWLASAAQPPVPAQPTAPPPPKREVKQPLIRSLLEMLTGAGDIEQADRDNLEKSLYDADDELTKAKELNRQAIEETNRQVAVGGAKNPNIVLIVLTGLGYSDLGCYGQTKIQTPHIDEFARTGTRFTQIYASAPGGLPSLAGLLTGRNVRHSGLDNERDLLPNETQTLHTMVWKAGYTTASIGPADPYALHSREALLRRCVEHSISFLNAPVASFPKTAWRNGVEITVPKNAAGEKELSAIDFLTLETLDYLDTRRAPVTAAERAAMPQDALAQWEYKQHLRNRRRPFFLHVQLPIPNMGDEPVKVDEAWSAEQKDIAASITRADAAVGRIIERLRLRRLLSNTIVVVTSDGGPVGEVDFFKRTGGLPGQGGELKEGGLRVPFITNWPNSANFSDQVVLAPAGIDPAPAAADAPTPAPVPLTPALTDRVQPAARSQLDLIRSISAAASSMRTPQSVDGGSLLGSPLTPGTVRVFYWADPKSGLEAVRAGKWKAVRTNPDQPVQLFDTEADPQEATNIAHDHPELAKKLAGAMDAAAKPMAKKAVARPR